MFAAFDVASLRRGYEVYRQVCSTCHSLKLIHYRNLVGVTHTREQATALAKSYEYEDGPNDEGEMFQRKGKLTDRLPSPYANDELARFANNNALPPDLSRVVKAKHAGSDYVFALLTGYGREPPAGFNKPGLHYNPYFDGGAIAMPPPLRDGMVEYEDGTVATVPQMAKDVTTFLEWCSKPEQDTRKKYGFQLTWILIAATALAGYHKRFAWASLKTRRISWIDVLPKK
jgi:ubiquinol-cytochrome c reductase cytochrome c1 subunit